MTSPLSAVEAIEKAMEGVTPGTWVAHQTVIHGHAYGGHWIEVADEDQLNQISGSGGARSYTHRVFDTQGHDDNEANARYVAACNPVDMREVLALARQAEALERENAELRELVENGQSFANQVRSITYHLNGQAYSSTVSELNQFDADLRRARTLLKEEANAE